MTFNPVRFSLVIRLISSVSTCNFLNFGMAMRMQVPTIKSSTTTATPVANVHCQLFPMILAMAQTAVIGAFSKTCSPMTTNICTCITSLVERVMRLAVENCPISPMVKDCTL